MTANTQHIFCGALTIDGCPVNSVLTCDNRKIAKMLNDNNKGFWSLQKPENIHPKYANDKVYLWISEND